MAILGEWQGNSVSILPGTTFAAPNGLFSGTAARNDGSAYSLASATSTLTLPASNLADGYLLVAAFEFEDTSNGRHNPQGRFVQASGTGNFVTNSTSGYNRDNSEDRAYVRCWAFVDNPSASSTFQFQWRRDTDAPTGGTVRSHLQVIPLYYAHHGIYSSASTACPGNTTVSQVVGWSAISESDTAQIELVSNVVSLKGDNKRYLCLGGQYWQGIGAARTQRWHGFRVNGVLDNSMRAYSYARNAANADIGNLFTTIVETQEDDSTLDQIVFRGDAVTPFPATGADVAGNTTGSNPAHAMVVLELNDSAEVFRSRSNLQQSLQTAGSRIAIDLVGTVDFNDSASFTKASNGGMNLETGMDVLFGANVAGGYNSTSTARHTAYIDATLNGVAQTYLFDGNYGRGNQGTQDTWGWSAHVLGFLAGTTNQDLGIDGGKISGGEGGTVHALSGWSQLWGINLDTLEGISSVGLAPADALHAHAADPPTLATSSPLAPEDATHGHIADEPALNTLTALDPEDADHGHTVDEPVIGFAADITPADSSHAHFADSPIVTASNALILDSALHSHTADELVVASAAPISPNDALHGHNAGSVMLAAAAALVLEGALHGHTADPLSLGSAFALTPADSVHQHFADQLSIGFKVSIAPAGSTHGHSAGSPTLDAGSALVLDDALHAHLAQALALSVAGSVAIDSSVHSVLSDEVVLATVSPIQPDDTLHGHLADSLTLGGAGVLSIDEALHSHTADELSLTVAFAISIDDATHALENDEPDLGTAGTLAPADTIHGHETDQPALDTAAGIAIDDSEHTHTADEPTLSPDGSLGPEDAAHAHTSSDPTLAPDYGLTIDGTVHDHTADAATLTEVLGLPIDGAVHGHTASQPDIDVQFGISPADSIHAHTADPAPISPNVDLAIDPALHATFADAPSIDAGALLIIEGTVHANLADQVILTGMGTISIDSALHNHLADEMRVGDPLITPSSRICVGDPSAPRLIVGTDSPRLATSLNPPRLAGC